MGGEAGYLTEASFCEKLLIVLHEELSNGVSSTKLQL
ncbi:hypothetical protein PMIT1318_02343 [Prochlorococcus marinus str. MIT 1318]|nr:hypothetical protein PMIT1318_02343 [Prochlorococcus marinus str. MIT 1318]